MVGEDAAPLRLFARIVDLSVRPASGLSPLPRGLVPGVALGATERE
jgi:hypothetical protein